MNPYLVLGVSEDSTDADIKSAFRKKALECHPDRHPGDKAKEEQFKRLSEANEILSKPDRRARYDQEEKRKKLQSAQSQASAQRHESHSPTTARQQVRQASRPQAHAPFSPPERQAQTAPHHRPRTTQMVQPIVASQSAGEDRDDGGDFWTLLFGAFVVGGLAYGASRVVKNSNTYWDSEVGRRRGPDGRFRSS